MANRAFIEGLESRVLLSAAPKPPVLFNPTIKADRLQVRADLLKFQSDIFSWDAKLLRDTTAVRENVAKGDTSLVAPFAALRTQVQAMRTSLLEDRLNESISALHDEATIKGDILQIIKDRKNSSAETADHAKLMGDRAQLQNDLVAGLNSRIATRTTDASAIATAAQGLVTAANSDPNASSALQAAVGTFATDRSNCVTALASDLQTIANARTQLSTDLTAAEST
ncbi:MAG TPA: LEPR-XLL domain-containing protein [Tepidisphaeraceae bacterium]|nr:LEPR-XLL domain-containing protein [Tepidisphaeraceae bacterium]